MCYSLSIVRCLDFLFVFVCCLFACLVPYVCFMIVLCSFRSVCLCNVLVYKLCACFRCCVPFDLNGFVCACLFCLFAFVCCLFACLFVRCCSFVPFVI